jgi:hypothetical protein
LNSILKMFVSTSYLNCLAGLLFWTCFLAFDWILNALTWLLSSSPERFKSPSSSSESTSSQDLYASSELALPLDFDFDLDLDLYLERAYPKVYCLTSTFSSSFTSST